ncbi:hypothetical protein V1503_18735 [Bacillus sp. SCS-151]|uniref:hypothetical protein n=1 Tax=Nanhaiella sioensis TaxID=3115293 RepID=UPI00397A410F
MSNRPEEYPFDQVKKLDESIHWDTQKQIELRQRIEKSLNKTNKRHNYVFRVLPLAGLAIVFCIIGILLAPYISEEEFNKLGNASTPVENTTEAALSVEEVLNKDSVIYYVNLDVTKGSECNFYLNNVHGGYNYKYKVYAPDGSLIGESTTADTQERLYAVDLSKYGSGRYKIKVYSQAGNIGGQYQLRVRNY